MRPMFICVSKFIMYIDLDVFPYCTVVVSNPKQQNIVARSNPQPGTETIVFLIYPVLTIGYN